MSPLLYLSAHLPDQTRWGFKQEWHKVTIWAVSGNEPVHSDATESFFLHYGTTSLFFELVNLHGTKTQELLRLLLDVAVNGINQPNEVLVSQCLLTDIYLQNTYSPATWVNNLSRALHLQKHPLSKINQLLPLESVDQNKKNRSFEGHPASALQPIQSMTTTLSNLIVAIGLAHLFLK